MPQTKEINSNNNIHPWTSSLSAYYQFVKQSGQFLKRHQLGDQDLKLISKIEASLESDEENIHKGWTKDVDMDSAILRDINNVLIYREFLKDYCKSELLNFKEIMDIEIRGLEGDLKPQTILVSTILAAVIIAFGLAASWSALWANYFNFDLVKIVVDTITQKLNETSWLRWIASAVFVFGGFVGIVWYVSISNRNLRQLAILKSLQRAILLYCLHENMDQTN